MKIQNLTTLSIHCNFSFQGVWELGFRFVFSLCVVCAHFNLTNMKYALYYYGPHFTDGESEM